MAYQISLACEDRDGRICDGGLGMGGNLYETEALCQRIGELKYGKHDPWWVAIEVFPGFPVLHDAHIAAHSRASYLALFVEGQDDIPF